MKNSSLRTPIKRARGLGASHSGTHHFWVQRVSALALIPLTVWFLVNILTHLLGTDRMAVSAWFADPLTALLMALLVVALFKHAQLGIQVIIEDYVHCEAKKLATLLFVNALIYGFGAASLLAIARIHFFEIF